MFIVVVADDVTGEVDSYGPFVEGVAHARAEAIHTDLHALGELDGIAVSVVPLGSSSDALG